MEDKNYLIDLHTHTTNSDGKFSPSELLNYARSKNVKILAISDHDTIVVYNNYKDLAKSYDVKLIPAVELSVSDLKYFHILGYGIKNVNYMESYLKKVRNKNESICKEILNLLKENYNISLNENEIKNYSKDNVLEKRNIVKNLIDKGYGSNIGDIYNLYLGENNKAHKSLVKITAKKAISLIHKCGGVAVIAHPTTLRTKDGKALTTQQFVSLIKGLKNIGLDGIECYNPKMNKQESLFYKHICEKQNLLITGGSDFHSKNLNHELGCAEMSVNHVKKLIIQLNS